MVEFQIYFAGAHTFFLNSGGGTGSSGLHVFTPDVPGHVVRAFSVPATGECTEILNLPAENRFHMEDVTPQCGAGHVYFAPDRNASLVDERFTPDPTAGAKFSFWLPVPCDIGSFNCTCLNGDDGRPLFKGTDRGRVFARKFATLQRFSYTADAFPAEGFGFWKPTAQAPGLLISAHLHHPVDDSEMAAHAKDAMDACCRHVTSLDLSLASDLIFEKCPSGETLMPCKPERILPPRSCAGLTVQFG